VRDGHGSPGKLDPQLGKGPGTRPRLSHCGARRFAALHREIVIAAGSISTYFATNGRKMPYFQGAAVSDLSSRDDRQGGANIALIIFLLLAAFWVTVAAAAWILL